MYDLTMPMGQMNYMSLMPSMGLTNNYANSVMSQNMLTSTGYNSALMSAVNPLNNPYSFGMGGGLQVPTSSTTQSSGAVSNFGFDPNYMFNYMDRNQDFMINYGIKQQTKMRNANMKVNSPEESVQLAASVLHNKILEDEQDQIKKAYNDYCARVCELYGGFEDKNALRARADVLYQQMTGKSIAQDLKEHGRSQFAQSFVKSISFGLSNSSSAAENAAYVTGSEEGRMERFQKIAGRIAGGATVGAATTVTAWGLGKIISPKWFKNKPLIGVAIGAIAAIFAAMRSDKAI